MARQKVRRTDGDIRELPSYSECPYHDDGDGFLGGGDCLNEGRIKTARYGWLCAECYDQLEAAWKYGLEHRDEMIALDRDGNNVA